MTDSPKLAWSIATFAKLNDLGESTIWNEIAAEELETMAVGDRTLITPEMRDRWVERKAERARQRRAARAKAREAEPAE
jgi:hypothetical protein